MSLNVFVKDLGLGWIGKSHLWCGPLTNFTIDFGRKNLWLNYLHKGWATKYIGFLVGFEIPQEAKNTKVIQQVRGKLSQWGQKQKNY
jgi:hypothetical protein